jgi:glycosyltransferase involved in cell wall biosynthesis
MTYAVVTPAHNEAANLERLLASLAAQTLPPERWVIVENGSTDGTLDVASELREAHDWIDVRSLPSQGPADRGAPIVRAIHEGLDTLERAGVAFDVVVVVDGDVTFPTGYFETLVSRFDADGRLGMASGTCFEQEHGVWQERHVTGDHVWGASRAYRREVLPIVMPLEPRMGWDGIDQIKANVAGWGTATFKDLPFYHHRPEGSRDGTGLKARINQGRASHYMGYRLSYLCLRTLFALRNDLAAPGLLVGYSLEAAARRERCPDAGVRQYVRTQQSATVWRRRLNEARGRR